MHAKDVEAFGLPVTMGGRKCGAMELLPYLILMVLRILIFLSYNYFYSVN